MAVESALRRLLDPRSIAFVGGARAALAAEQCDGLGFDGEMWMVHPSRSEMARRATFPSLADLPAVPDAVFVGVRADDAIEVVASCAEAGVGGVVVYASGFAETGVDGAALQSRLVAVAGDLPIIGPNCHGFLNAITGAALWPDVSGCERIGGGVALITQSGSLAINLTMQRRGLPIAMGVTLGNQAAVGFADIIDALVDDDRITAFGLHVEGLRDPAAFAAAAVRAHAAGKPIVALRTGASADGAAIATSHTASLAGAAAAYRALFARCGVSMVDTPDALLGALAVVGHGGRLGGNRMVSLSCSGGEASLVADLADPLDLVFPAFDAATSARLDAVLDHRVAIANPLDYHTFIWDDAAALEECFSTALASAVDVAMLVIDWPAPGLDDAAWWPPLGAFIDAVATTGQRAIVTSSVLENLPPVVARRLAEHGIATVPGVATALASIVAARPTSPITEPHLAPPRVAERTTVGEADAKGLLARAGLPVPLGEVAARSNAGAAAERIGFPVVAKTVGQVHKSDVGGVVVDVRDMNQLETALAALSGVGEHVLVERYVSGVIAELLVGVQVDEPIGWTLTVGTGGILTELFGDTVTLLLPVTKEEVAAALGNLAVAAVLDGYRGGAGVDIAGAVDAIVAVTELAVAEPMEIEINPLAVTSSGVWVLDALIEELR